MLANQLSQMATTICRKHHISFKTLKSYDSSFEIISEDVTYVEDTQEHLNIDRLLENETRVKTGSYYTPTALAEKMSRIALYDYFVQQDVLSKEKCKLLFMDSSSTLLESEKQYITQALRNLHIIDIACGTGAFLRSLYNIIESTFDLLKVNFPIHEIIRNLHGVDIQSEPLLILKLWYVEKLLEAGGSPIALNLSISDSLLHTYEHKYDLVIGNPPYVGEKGNKAIFDQYKHLQGYEGRMDLFYFFIYQGMAILKTDGLLMYITTNYWITADGAVKLRKYIKDHTFAQRMINLDDCKLFKDAKGMHNLIFTLSKQITHKTKIQTLNSKNADLDQLFDHLYEVEASELFSESGNILLYEDIRFKNIVDKMLKYAPKRLKDYAKINQGIVSGADKVTDQMLTKKLSSEEISVFDIKKDHPIFVLEGISINSKFEKPFYKNSQIGRYHIKDETDKKILYLTDADELAPESVEINHLMPYRSVLNQRREVKQGRRSWYALQWYRSQSIFEGEKIVVPQRSLYNDFAYSCSPFYSSADIYYITEGPLKYLLGILNSKIIYFWLYTRGKRKGQSLELYANPLAQIPILDANKSVQLEIVACVDRILKHNDVIIESRKIDEILYKEFNLSIKEIEIIERLYNRSENA